jgi:hypothetical protein
VLARNAIPVVGVYVFGWSTDRVIFQIWFDGLTALGTMLAFHMRALAGRGGKPFDAPPGLPKSARPVVLTLAWLILFLLLAIPYWFMILFIGGMVFDDGFWKRLLSDGAAILALLFVLASNVVEESRRGYERMSDAESRLEFNWDFSMHLARIAATMLVTFAMRLGLIVGLALVLSYVEIYPMRTLRLLGGDSTLEAENETRSRD